MDIETEAEAEARRERMLVRVQVVVVVVVVVHRLLAMTCKSRQDRLRRTGRPRVSRT